MKSRLNRLQQALGYEFSSVGLLETALSHRSVGIHNNERSEFLGDAILGFVIADQLFHKFPDADEGQLSRLRAALVKKETLAEISRQLNIGQYLRLGMGELKSGGHARDSILADTLEAIIGAIYLDSGSFQHTGEIILGLYQQRLSELTLKRGQKDPKTRLQEWLQGQKSALPEYRVIHASGPQHKQLFEVCCSIPETDVETRGSGSSKRKAEQEAASRMLEHYGQ